MGSNLGVEHGPERPVNGVTRRLASTDAASRDLGFTASVGLAEGLRNLVAWWQAERAWMRQRHNSSESRHESDQCDAAVPRARKRSRRSPK